jgi:hypothetical protein
MNWAVSAAWEAAAALFQVVSQRYVKTSVVMTTAALLHASYTGVGRRRPRAQSASSERLTVA